MIRFLVWTEFVVRLVLERYSGRIMGRPEENTPGNHGIHKNKFGESSRLSPSLFGVNLALVHNIVNGPVSVILKGQEIPSFAGDGHMHCATSREMECLNTLVAS
jgi:hypothetical protein